MKALVADVAWGQIQGARESQQDSAAVVSWPNGYCLLILADGMGGNVGGKEASNAVVNAFRASFLGSNADSIASRLLEALNAANLEIYRITRERDDLAGMGSTLLALVFDGYGVQWISVGDSPLWIYRSGEIRRLNANHSMAAVLAERVARGELSAEEAATSPERTQLLEAVLGKDIALVDLPDEALPLVPADILLLASDGVETCSTAELEEVLGGADRAAEDVVQRVLGQVQSHGRRSQDNATLVALRVLSEVIEPATRESATVS